MRPATATSSTVFLIVGCLTLLICGAKSTGVSRRSPDFDMTSGYPAIGKRQTAGIAESYNNAEVDSPVSRGEFQRMVDAVDRLAQRLQELENLRCDYRLPSATEARVVDLLLLARGGERS